MPNYWVTVGMSPPKQRRDEIREKLTAYNAELREDQLYQPAHRGDIGFVLIKVPDRTTNVPKMLRAIGAIDYDELVDVDEAEELYLTGPGSAESQAEPAA